MSRGVLLIIAAAILSGSLFLPWHYSIEERPMKPNLSRTSDDGDKVILACWHYKTPSVVGYQTPSVLMVVVPLVILLGACGLLFVLRPNIQGHMVAFGPASVAALGVIAILWILYKFDCPDTGGILAFIVAICSIPVSFVTKRQNQLAGSA